MKIPIAFMKDLFSQPAPIWLWVVSLVCINMAGLFFWHETTALVIVATFMVSGALIMGLYARFGYSRIMGLGHCLWLVLLPWLVFQIDGATGLFQGYLYLICAAIAVSLVLDIRDVWLHFTTGSETD